MSETLKVAVVDRSRTLYQGDASQVILPSADGDLGVLPGHQPLLVVLRPGHVRVDAVGEGAAGGAAGTKEIKVESGFASVDHDAVTVVLERDLRGEVPGAPGAPGGAAADASQPDAK